MPNGNQHLYADELLDKFDWIAGLIIAPFLISGVVGVVTIVSGVGVTFGKYFGEGEFVAISAICFLATSFEIRQTRRIFASVLHPRDFLVLQTLSFWIGVTLISAFAAIRAEMLTIHSYNPHLLGAQSQDAELLFAGASVVLAFFCISFACLALQRALTRIHDALGL